MEKTAPKKGKVFPVFAGICILALPLVVLSAFSSSRPSAEKSETAVLQSQNLDFDYKGSSVFRTYARISEDYVKGASSERTLEEYYSRRQYIGSPPYIPHEVKEADLAEVDCLSCHGKGGWTQELKRHTPITPHPEQTACRQCHVRPMATDLFVETDWKSVAPPRLGESHLPGAPVPIPHDLQYRGDCIACHVGPAAVTPIRSDHPLRGNCRQCHVPSSDTASFKRNSDS